MAAAGEAGSEGAVALRRLREGDPPSWLTPSPELAGAARAASAHLFATLSPHCPKCPLTKLLIEGFDAEQIWQQIDLQALSVLPGLRREVRRLEKNPPTLGGVGGEGAEEQKGEIEAMEKEDSEVSAGEEEEEEEEEEKDEMEDDEGEEEDEEEGGEGIEDKFLKIKDLEKFLEEEEKREFEGGAEEAADDDAEGEDEDGDDEEEDGKGEEDDDEDDEDDDEIGLGVIGSEANLHEKSTKYPRYGDFFGNKKRKRVANKQLSGSEDLGTDEEGTEAAAHNQLLGEPEELLIENDTNGHKQESGSLSTHEKQLEKVRSKIKEMERANLEPKTWTMQGEVTAAKRPKNSALEVDLDFEHNVRPAPVITEEITASLEDIIKQRIVEGHFDDVQRTASLGSKEPKEMKELDENKSQKGLAEIYEEEYTQKTGLAPTPLSFRDELKKEASLLFKKLCLRLDALSHFHFAPKPVIEDMSIQTNVPALAMEEVAPLAVSDAAMLAPEEVFAGRGDIKEEGELTRADRKRRRAKKKRKFKAESARKMVNKAPLPHVNGKDSS